MWLFITNDCDRHKKIQLFLLVSPSPFESGHLSRIEAALNTTNVSYKSALKKPIIHLKKKKDNQLDLFDACIH